MVKLNEEAARPELRVTGQGLGGMHNSGADAVALEQPLPPVRSLVAPDQGQGKGVDGVVIRLPRIANFDDFDPLARERGVAIPEATAFQAQTGLGVRATVNGQSICAGNWRYFDGYQHEGVDFVGREMERLQEAGKTSIVVARLSADGGTATLLGVIAIADVLRHDAAKMVRDLKSLGVERVVMLTGDHARVAKTIAAQAGVDEFYADLMPEEKLQIIKNLKSEYGITAMVGDGVNDAPALAAADVGIAMGAAGSDVALETADIVLMSDNLDNLPYVIALSRQTRKTLVANLSFALGMIALLVVSVLVVQLPLPLSVIGHEGSTVLVSLNGLRLLVYRR